MVKKFLKSSSKRVTSRKRNKIEKKVREHNRKLKKLDKMKKGSKKKLIIVPGDCPFKLQILTEAITLRRSIEDAKETKKEQVKVDRKARREAIVANNRIGAAMKLAPGTISLSKPKEDVETPEKPVDSFEELRKKAEERGYTFEKLKGNRGVDGSLKAFYNEFQQVVNDSDVVIEVLDSRDPLGTRSSEAEEVVRSHSDKKLIFVLNKCDLVPAENIQKWIHYLKQTEGVAAVAFKSNTQKQRDQLGSIGSVKSDGKQKETKKSIGVNDLLGLLGTWSRGTPGGVTVGVIGMPNVGKSSLVNSLKRSKACNVGAKPGVTRTCQIVNLDAKLRLVDSPGVCFPKEKEASTINVDKIIARVPRITLQDHYKISDFEDSTEFLSLVGKKFGYLRKGGLTNTTAAEQKVLHDWHTGALRFYTEPPELGSSTISSAILSGFSAPFSLDGPQEVEMEGEEDSEEDMEMEGVESSGKKKVTFAVEVGGGARRSQRNKAAVALKADAPSKQKIHGLVSTKKVLLKKLRKSKKKSAKQASALSDMVDNMSFDF